MREFTMKIIDWRVVINLLKTYFGKNGSHVWESNDIVSAVFHHESFMSSKYSVHLVSIIFEYDYVSGSGLFTIYGSEARRGEVSSRDIEKKVEEIISVKVRERENADLSEIMGNRRYCVKCKKWDSYEIESGQSTVVCKSCGLEISLEEN